MYLLLVKVSLDKPHFSFPIKKTYDFQPHVFGYNRVIILNYSSIVA